ncbi:AAA family ATPase [Micromonospora sp. C51]|uniref:BTAD domain-containing putative transcriptional regulator n=1 Tax=Micromonospora sp. C51 TaxID=2824879 RepID=UPI001B35F7C1|nr:BTAD domain-containing putative transcriptional regulator [Micromonospora sp. C51]MBQ1047388.1 AAA family ATPase [Micromonospora sp. C51]
MTRQDTVPAVSFGVLGAVTAWAGGLPVGLKGPRHRAVLARLLIARGRVVPVDQLLADLWHPSSEGSIAAIRTFVADLRRALEPERPARRPARLLITTPPGYALRAPADTVDAWRFEAAVVESGRLLDQGHPEAALTGLDGAFALWRGPAYAGYDGEGWARGEINRLDDLRLLGSQRRAEALMALGRDVEAATVLRDDAEAHPLREDIWRLWIVALYRSGRQGEALAALRRVRASLVDELGIDPGPRLRQLEGDILRQAPHLAPTTPTPPTPVPTPVPASSPGVPAGTDGTTPERPDVPPGRRPFVGREPELDRLVRVAAETARDGVPAVALISGDAGAGKTALLDALTRRLSADGWVTAWGRVPEYDGAPTAWPWTQINQALTERVRPAQQATPAPPAVAGPVPGDGGERNLETLRFHLRREAISLVDTAARKAPVLLVLDDLHRADEGTLDLLTGLFAEPAPASGPVMIVAAYRTSQVGAGLTATLARLAPREPARVYLTGLPEVATAELTRAVVGFDVDATTLRSIHHRSGGNPFFVRELARLLAAEGPQALARVPAGVRDVIRHRLTQLPEATRTLLRQAAVVGRDVDPEVLSALTGEPEPVVLDALDQAEQAGFLGAHGTAGQLRFTHILVRDTLYDDLPAARRARWHAATGEALERLHPHQTAALAHHFTAAGNQATAGRAARYARSAAEQAEARAAPHDAVRLWEQAVTAYDRATDGDARGRLAAQMGLGRALAVTGRLAQARRHRAAAITTAQRLDDPELLADVLTAFDVPAIWTRNDDEPLSRQVALAVETALAGLPPDDRTRRGHLLATLALELRGSTGDRGSRAAREAEDIARRTGDVPLLALALNARYLHTFHRAGLAPERARLGVELAEVARSRNLVTFEVLGHLIAMQAYCAVGDLATADARATAADHLARRYELPLVGLFTRWYAALRLAIEGRPAEAEAAYREADHALPADELPGMARGLAPLALFCLRLTTGGEPTPGETVRWRDEDWGPYEPWVRPLLLLAAGHRTEAAEALEAVPDSPHDLLREARGCLVARAALALGDRSRIRATYADLLPADGELAGAGSGVLTLGPVARHLGDLAAALGDHDRAQVHYSSARG